MLRKSPAILHSFRQILSKSIVVGCALSLSLIGHVAMAQSNPRAPRSRLRIMAANTTSGNQQSYDPGEGTRIFQGLQPDIVLIQEFNIGNNTETAVTDWVQSTFGPEFTYYREDNAQIPNGIISRYPIITAGEWNDSQVGNRDFAWAQIDIPGERDLWAVSVHFLTRSSTVRNTEANAVLRLVTENIPAEDYLVIGGDFNTRNSGESALGTLDAVVDTDPPYPTDQSGKIGTNASRRRPYDWVFADDELDPLEIPVVIGSNTFDSGLVFDSRVYEPLSEVSPVERSDSGATNMQHMAVIKDYEIPTSEAIEPTTLEPAPSQQPEDPLSAFTSPERLQSCVPVSALANSDGLQHYVIEIPNDASQLEITLEGLTEGSDLDLYATQGRLSTLDSYDFRPWLTDSNERIIINEASTPALSPGQWFISVDGHIPGEYRLNAAIDKCTQRSR